MKRRYSVFLIILLFAVTACDSGGYDEADYEPADSGDSSAAPGAPAATATQPPTETTTTMTKWDLWAGGSTQLRGANIHQRLVYPELDGTDYMGPGPLGPPFTQEDFDKLSALGANYVNISHPGLFMENPPYTVSEDAVSNLDRLLTMIELADMFAVISFRTGPGRSEFTFFDYPSDWFDESYLNDAVWEDKVIQDAWVDMWTYTAERYRDSAVVAGYDLMVEPNAEYICCELWDETEEFYPDYAGTLYDWNQFFPRIISGIRTVDPDTPVIVGSLGMSQITWLPFIVPADDPRTLYAIHQYTPAEYTHQEPGLLGGLPNTYPGSFDLDWDNRPDDFDYDWLADLMKPVDEFMREYGVIVTSNEFGPMRFEPGAAQFVRDQVAIFEARGMNHAIWEWGPAWEPLREEQQEFAFRLGTDVKAFREDAPSDLQDTIRELWAANVYFPSNVTFIPAEQ